MMLLGGRNLKTVLTLILVLAAAADAIPEAVQLGPYNLSFDLNTSMSYQVAVEKPVMAVGMGNNMGNTYGLSVKGNDSLISIFITGNQDLRHANYLANRAVVEGFLVDAKCTNINITDEVIDNHVAALGGGLMPSGKVIFAASYSPDATSVNDGYMGKTICRLFSTFPLEETRELLRSIHVEVSDS
jgi:hypothetical protein